MNGRVRISGEWMDMEYDQESNAKIQIVSPESLFARIADASVDVQFYGQTLVQGVADRTGRISLGKSIPVDETK